MHTCTVEPWGLPYNLILISYFFTFSSSTVYSYQAYIVKDNYILVLITAANLLIDYNCQRLKVADFGCAELLEECCHGKGFPESKDAGTLWYNPPEVRLN